jgi:branched-chain amino acid transport system substrate-binding protein
MLIPGHGFAQQPIKVGYPMILSGPGALFGEPALKGAQMFVEEINGKGGVLGRKIELVPRDTKGNADEAVRVSRELILKDNVDFLVGTLTSAEGPAVSTIAKEKQDRLHRADTQDGPADRPGQPAPLRVPDRLQHHHRGAHGRRDRRQMAVKKIATIAPDYAYGQDVAKAFVEHIKKIKPEVEIVDQQWPKLGEADYNALHQRADGQEARGRLLGPLGWAFPDLRQAGQAA